LVVTGSSSMTAGSTNSLTITAYDLYGNTATGYTGNKTLTFSGASVSANGYTPTATNNLSANINFGSNTVVNFASGVGTSTATLYTAETAHISVTDGTINATGHTLAVTVSPATANYLVVTGSSSMTAGSTNSLTITAYDLYGNTATGYTGNKTLTFSGASVSANGNHPTATDDTSANINFGSNTVVNFASGVGTSTSTLYTAETAHISVTDGTINSTGHTLAV